ncbi:unnamed protein product [Anisakis simplex]|uniref:Oxidoreductase n=1 Tax=Anisakis simplex TaxID=6269 RepID=A0A0M3KB38_ANISI|nr:unnamed protein product [Anisakis simplex]
MMASSAEEDDHHADDPQKTDLWQQTLQTVRMVDSVYDMRELHRACRLPALSRSGFRYQKYYPGGFQFMLPY